MLLDKTGTLTLGVPGHRAGDRVHDGVARAELLRLAASLDQLSTHVLAAAIVRQAAHEAIALDAPAARTRVAGQGIEGIVDGHSVIVGSAALAGGERDRRRARERPRRRRHHGARGRRRPARRDAVARRPRAPRRPRAGPAVARERDRAGGDAQRRSRGGRGRRRRAASSSTASTHSRAPRTSSRWCARCRQRRDSHR